MMSILGWIFVIFLVFIVGFIAGFLSAAAAQLSTMRRNGFTDEEIAKAYRK